MAWHIWITFFLIYPVLYIVKVRGESAFTTDKYTSLIHYGNTRVSRACRRGILNKYHGTRKIHEVKNNKNGGICRRAWLIRDKEIKKKYSVLKEFFGIIYIIYRLSARGIRRNISFSDDISISGFKYHHLMKYFAIFPSL